MHRDAAKALPAASLAGFVNLKATWEGGNRPHIITLIIDGKIVQLVFVGYEKDEEATWCYFQVNNILSVKKIDVNDNLLLEYKKEQINLLHVIINGIRKSTKLDNHESKVSLAF